MKYYALHMEQIYVCQVPLVKEEILQNKYLFKKKAIIKKNLARTNCHKQNDKNINFIKTVMLLKRFFMISVISNSQNQTYYIKE